MYHYVYRLDHIETGEFYIGSRSSKKHPTMDGYLGSMKTWKPDKTKLIKTILKDGFKNREESMIFERVKISENIKDDLNRNYHIPGVGFHTNGTVSVKDKDGNTSKVSVDDPRYLSGELVSIMCGVVVVVDGDGNIFNTSVDDPRYLSGELTSSTKGFLTIRDDKGNTQRMSIKDPRYLNGEFNHISKGMVVVKDKDDNIMFVSVDDPRYLSGELSFHLVGLKHTEESKRKIGEANSIKQRGSGNSQYGTCWIHNEKKSIKIKKTELDNYLNDGWIKGRKMKFKTNVSS